MRLRARLAAALRPPARAGVQHLPQRVWPGEEAAWRDENGVRHPRAVRRALAALAALEPRGRYGARIEGRGKVVTGPASALVLRDAEAEIGFVLGLTPDGYGAEPF
ncbi:hypothetical protein SAMN02799636_04911 [Methylobacterium sp. 275MFSha3.1]|uniref:hypothetical protein n=1 Tax=Methylobacterium sp. 275MFSha3.1 TaxID=1502746 RepID=UPI0008A773E6|nr:hypothetical protein [Methylobacterium sp. 275MFSha3.1]SEI01127.1 hypothetical protein SAMN02799636_04911 [Methylobacterium sp. 275MFSha3.1]